MDQARYHELMSVKDDDAKLTQEEIDEGWHFCPEWDFLLTNWKETDPAKGETCGCGCGSLGD